MIANLESYGIAQTGANQSTPMISYIGKKTIETIHILSKRNVNQIPAEGQKSHMPKINVDKEAKKAIQKQLEKKPQEQKNTFVGLTSIQAYKLFMKNRQDNNRNNTNTIVQPE